MNIVVLGGGRVGSSIAEILSQEEHSVAIIDQDPQVTKRLNDELDVLVVTGNASKSSILFQAGVPSCDVLLAMTGNDEVNILAASMAKAMGARRSVARVYAPVFLDLSSFDYGTHFGIDRILSLENLTALELARSIRDPNAVLVEQFARGSLSGQTFLIEKESKLTKGKLMEVKLPAEIRIGTIERESRTWIASGEDQIQVGDSVTVFFQHSATQAVHKLFQISPKQKRRVVIGGGGETAFHLARTLEREQFSIMIIEKDANRCERLAANLENTVVVNADATHMDELQEHRVGNADFFVACTGEDDRNIMQCVEAKDLGVNNILALIAKKDYLNLVSKLGIDLAVSQRNVMARQVLAYLTDGVEISRFKLPGGLINVIEVEVLEDTPITTAPLAETELPPRCLVVAVIHNETVRIATGTTRLVGGDLAVILVEEDVAEKALWFFKQGT